ncbi:IclR family transcriptional regulator, partial [Escherichia coli]
MYHLFPTSLCGTLQQYHQEKRMAETSSTTAGAQTLLRGLAVLNAVYNGCHDLKSIGEFTGTTRS